MITKPIKKSKFTKEWVKLPGTEKEVYLPVRQTITENKHFFVKYDFHYPIPGTIACTKSYTEYNKVDDTLEAAVKRAIKSLENWESGLNKDLEQTLNKVRQIKQQIKNNQKEMLALKESNFEIKCIELED